MARETQEESTHDYEPGEEHHPMHTDPLCRVCGRPSTSYLHH